MALARLDVEAPELATTLRGASDTRRSAIVAKACGDAVTFSGLADPDAMDALEAIQRGSTDPVLAGRMTALAERLDAQYFDAQDRGDDDWPVRFRKARAASALACGLAVTDQATAAEAVYEAAHAAEDPSSIYRSAVE